MAKKEHDLKVLDLWQSSNGNLFLKVNESHSIALGTFESFNDIDTDEEFNAIKSNPITTVRKVGVLKINTKKLKRD